jgi:hypothetical protein
MGDGLLATIGATSNLEDLAARIAALVALDRSGTARALEIGRLLLDAKAQINRGGWLAFVKKSGLTARTAQLYMRVATKWKDEPDAQRVAHMALRDVQKMMAAPRARSVPPTAFPTGNIDALPTGTCAACGRSCGCAPASVDEEAA